MGHEVAGQVVEAGSDVDRSWIGQLVTCETFFSTCGRCTSCRDGRPNLCLERRSIGSGVDGGFAALMVLPARNLHRVPDGVDAHAAALSEPLACVCNALCDSSVVSPGDDVLVTGPGPIGLLAAQVARASGGHVLVVGTDRDEIRLAKARELGFDAALASEGHVIDALGGALGADVSIECSGSGAGAGTCLEHSRRGGRYVQMGLAGQPVKVPMDEICYRELLVTSGFASTPRSWRRTLRMITSGMVQLAPLVSEVVPLDDWERVFADTRAGRGIKYVFDPRI